MNFEDEKQPVPPAQMAEIISVAQKMVDLRRQEQEFLNKAKALGQEAQALEGADLPDMMTGAGMKSFELKDGTKIELKPFLNAGLPAPGGIDKATGEKQAEMIRRLNAGVKWLRENHGGESLVKSAIEINLGKNAEQNSAAQILELAMELGYEARETLSVHSGALGAFLRELDKKEVKFPHDVFGVYSGTKASFTDPK